MPRDAQGPYTGEDLMVCPACSRLCEFLSLVEERGVIACKKCLAI